MQDGQDGRYVGEFEDRCQGARDSDHYVVAMNVASAKTKRRFVHAGSDMLDRINAFDMAEVRRMHMGQINLIEVSSFCGPKGIVWGRDVAAHPDLRKRVLARLPQRYGEEVPVYSADALVSAAADLFGTVGRPGFPFAPGTHCPTASKSVTHVGTGTIYAACALGVRADGAESASIFMEDVGMLSPDAAGDPAAAGIEVTRAAAASVLAVAENQRIACKEVFVSFVSESLAEDEVGCCVTLVPYFSLAKRAAPDGIRPLRDMTLDEWKRRCRP